MLRQRKIIRFICSKSIVVFQLGLLVARLLQSVVLQCMYCSYHTVHLLDTYFIISNKTFQGSQVTAYNVHIGYSCLHMNICATHNYTCFNIMASVCDKQIRRSDL